MEFNIHQLGQTSPGYTEISASPMIYCISTLINGPQNL